jgi:hypothetical protein
LLCCRCCIWAPRRSRMLRAMAVPSILVAVMRGVLLEKRRRGVVNSETDADRGVTVALTAASPAPRRAMIGTLMTKRAVGRKLRTTGEKSFGRGHSYLQASGRRS